MVLRKPEGISSACWVFIINGCCDYKERFYVVVTFWVFCVKNYIILQSNLMGFCADGKNAQKKYLWKFKVLPLLTPIIKYSLIFQ